MFAHHAMNNHSSTTDLRAFPYLPPSPDLVQRYQFLFKTGCFIRESRIKRVVDISSALILLLLCLPLWLVIGTAIWLDGFVHRANAGPILDPYVSASRGRKFLKWKFRVLKIEGCIARTRRLDWRHRLSEHNPANLTCVGRILKRYYLDELPQFLNILCGDMSIVGPRPLAWHHYLRNVAQGHPLRKILKAGLISPTHARKGSATFPDPEFDYGYAEVYSGGSAFRLLWEDAKAIGLAFRVLIDGRGL